MTQANTQFRATGDFNAAAEHFSTPYAFDYIPRVHPERGSITDRLMGLGAIMLSAAAVAFAINEGVDSINFDAPSGSRMAHIMRDHPFQGFDNPTTISPQDLKAAGDISRAP